MDASNSKSKVSTTTETLGNPPDSRFLKCHKCGKVHKRTDLIEACTPEGNILLCGNCIQAYCHKCADCGRYFLIDGRMCHSVYGYGLVCDECLRRSDRYFLCSSCNAWYLQEHYVEGGLCSFCDDESDDGDEDSDYDDEEDRWGVIYDYHDFNVIEFHKTNAHCDIIGTPLYLGFELESGGIGSISDLRKIAEHIVETYSAEEYYFHLERDASISSGGGKYGFEMISMPMTLDFHKSFPWRDILHYMDCSGLNGHDLGENCCGLHVHFSRNFLSAMDMVKLDYFVALHRKEFELIARRGQNNWVCYKDRAEMKSLGKGCDHYDAINFGNRDTVEIRIFRSSLRYETLIATLEIVDGLVRFVKTLKAADLIRDKHGSWRLFPAFLKANKARYSNALEYFAERNVAV